ncbi:MAG: hypothetical protein ACRCUC_13075 [Aestuariivirga sp.]
MARDNRHTFGLNLIAQATSVNSPDLECLSGAATQIIIDVTAITGTTPALVVTIEGKDPFSGKYYPIIVSASITTVSTTVLRVFPGATPAANLAVNDFLPRTFRIAAAITGTTPAVTARINVNANEA